MKVGVARETTPGERRVALVPEVLGKLTAAGLEVLVEAGAGAGAAIPDAAGSSSQGACPRAPSLGVVRFPRGGKEHVVSLATCTDRVTGKATEWRPPGSFRSSIDGARHGY